MMPMHEEVDSPFATFGTRRRSSMRRRIPTTRTKTGSPTPSSSPRRMSHAHDGSPHCWAFAGATHCAQRRQFQPQLRPSRQPPGIAIYRCYVSSIQTGSSCPASLADTQTTGQRCPLHAADAWPDTSSSTTQIDRVPDSWHSLCCQMTRLDDEGAPSSGGAACHLASDAGLAYSAARTGCCALPGTNDLVSRVEIGRMGAWQRGRRLPKPNSGSAFPR